MFEFIIRYLNFLKHVPLLPHIFDSLMLFHCYFFDRKIISTMEQIEAAVQQWDDITISIHRYGGMQFNYRNKEIGHMHGNGIVDIPFPREIKNKLLIEGKAYEHHTLKATGWISYYLNKNADPASPIELLKLSYNLKIGENKIFL